MTNKKYSNKNLVDSGIIYTFAAEKRNFITNNKNN